MTRFIPESADHCDRTRDTAMKWNRKRRLGQDKGVTVYVAEALVGEFAA